MLPSLCFLILSTTIFLPAFHSRAIQRQMNSCNISLPHLPPACHKAHPNHPILHHFNACCHLCNLSCRPSQLSHPPPLQRMLPPLQLVMPPIPTIPSPTTATHVAISFPTRQNLPAPHYLQSTRHIIPPHAVKTE